MGSEIATARLVDQRLRNRIMEELLGLSEGASGVNKVGATEWFESFFDYFEYEGDVHPRADLTTISHPEMEALTRVVAVMQDAVRGTPRRMTEEYLISSGWPLKVQPIAQDALRVFMIRGRFSEDSEEDEPSGDNWPYC